MPVKTEPRAFTASPLTSLLPSSLLSSPTAFAFPSALHPSVTSLSPNPTLSLPSALPRANLGTTSLSALGTLSSFGTRTLGTLGTLGSLGALKTDKPPQVFAGLRFVLDLPPDAPLKEKTLWRRRLLDGGAQIAYSMSKRVCSTFYSMLRLAIIALSAHYCIDDMMTNRVVCPGQKRLLLSMVKIP